MIAVERLAKGYLLRTCFLQFFDRVVVKKTAVLNQVVFYFGKVCFSSVFTTHLVMIKNNSTKIEIKIDKEYWKHTLNRLRKLFVAIAVACLLLRMLTHLGISWQSKFERGEQKNNIVRTEKIWEFLKIIFYYCASNITHQKMFSPFDFSILLVQLLRTPSIDTTKFPVWFLSYMDMFQVVLHY